MRVDIFEIQTENPEQTYRMRVFAAEGIEGVTAIYEGTFRQILNALLEVQNPENQTLCIRKKN